MLSLLPLIFSYLFYSQLKEQAEADRLAAEEQQRADAELETNIRHLRDALSSLPQDFLTEIKLPPKYNLEKKN
jgi:hypothetical protein